MENYASLAIEQINRMHNAPTHNKENTLRQNRLDFNDTPSNSLKDSNTNPKVKITEEGVRVHSLAHSTSRVKKHVKAPRWGLGRVTSGSIIHMDLHKPNNNLFGAQLKYFWCTDEPRVYTDSQDSPQPGLGGNHHLPPYSNIYD